MFLSKKKYTTKLLPIIFCLLGLLLTGCSNTPQKSLVKAPASKQIYTIPETGITDFDTLDPALAHDSTSTNAIQMMYTGMVQLNDQLQVRPQLAQSWSQSGDGMTWTFHLRPNLKFNDGKSLTSADVAYSLDRALQPATRSTVAPLYLGLIRDADQLLSGRVQTLIGDSIQTPDPDTVTITTRKKAAYFLSMLTMPCSYVVEKSLITQYGTGFTDHLSQGGGAGPFKVAQYIHGQTLSFVPDPYYYGAKPQLQHVKFVFYPSDDTAYQAYLANRVDTTGIPLSIYATDKKRKDFYQVPQLWTNYYTMNYLVKPFDNIHIRQAFELAIDKKTIATTVWKNAVLPTNHIVPQGMPGYNSDLAGPDGTQNLTGNTTLAQNLLQQGLKEEGWSSVAQMPAITLTYASGVSNFDQEVAALVQMWQKVLNVRVSTTTLDYNTLLDKITASTGSQDGLQLWGLAWVDEYPDPQDWLSLQFGQGVVNNNMNYGQNVSADAAQQQMTQQNLASADANPVADARIQAYQKAEQQLVKDVAWLPMEQVTSTFLRSPFIVGFFNNAQGTTPPDDWAKIYRLQLQ
ncbi:MAG: peptide ABC transporter substrate-binding protein [Ktedonobacteraceae bacterium]|nr:peptide ABC transporter substrate-binding protein [Ktedonobacteraceae bacterium]